MLAVALCGCDPDAPEYLDGPRHNIELPALPQQYTRPVEPSLAVLVDQDQAVWNTSYLHTKWREGLRRHFRAELAESNRWAAWQEHREMVSSLEERPYFQEPNAAPVPLENGHVVDDESQRASKGYIQALYDELFAVVGSVCWPHRFLDLEPTYLGPHCSSIPDRTVLVVAGREVPWSTVQRVIYTGVEFGIDVLQFAVDGDRRAIDVDVRATALPGPPSDVQTPTCALATVYQVDAGLDVRYIPARVVQRTRYGKGLGQKYVAFYVDAVDPADLGDARGADARAWAGATAVRRQESSASVESGALGDMIASMRLLHDSFDRLPTCETAVFMGKGYSCSGCSDVEQALKALVVIKQGGAFDRLLVPGIGRKHPKLSETRSDQVVVLDAE